MATKKTATPEEPNKTAAALISIPPLNIRRVVLRVSGDSLLCTHPFSEKAMKQMLDAMRGGPKPKREAKDPQAEYEASKYINEDGQCCMRAIAFKSAAVDAASQFDKSLTKVFLRGVFHIPTELLVIDGEPRMREDVVRVGMGAADLRYRAEFWPWSIDVPVRYNASNIDIPSLVQLFRMAGFASGIGEYRPQRDGNWGMFHVDSVIDEGTEQ